MLLKIVKTSALVAITASVLSAASFNAQAEKDRIALEKYTVEKFENPVKNMNRFFPYSGDAELKAWKHNIKSAEFKDGSYAYNMTGKESRDDFMEMSPYDDAIEAGEASYNKSFSTCFKKGDAIKYPLFDEAKGKVVTLTGALMQCVKDAGLDKLKNKKGKSVWGWKGGKMAQLQSYLNNISAEAGKYVDVKINSKAAAAAYEHGKKEFYAQRGYLEMSCATCHVQGAGQRVRLEFLSPLLGGVSHFPVYRLGKEKFFTIEGRLGGCQFNQGTVPHKNGSDWSNDVIYFLSYMSNGMDIALDVRR